MFVSLLQLLMPLPRSPHRAKHNHQSPHSYIDRQKDQRQQQQRQRDLARRADMLVGSRERIGRASQTRPAGRAGELSQ